MHRETLAYYRAALIGLRFLEARRPTRRRFGEDADALWKGFRGDLGASHRLDLLIRDANAEWPGALGARTVFDLRAVAEDDPFGANWSPLESADAEELWRSVMSEQAATDPGTLFSAVASTWGLTLQPLELAQISATDRLVVVGPSAIAAVAQRFSESPTLDWIDQVVCVATLPAHRQMAALGTAVVNAAKAGRIYSANAVSASHEALRRELVGRRVVSSQDASEDDLAAAKSAVLTVGAA